MPEPRESIARRVRSPTWVVLCALAARVNADGTVRVAPAALARTLRLTEQNVRDAIDEFVAESVAAVVARSPFGAVVLNIKNALDSSPPPAMSP